MMPPLLSLQDLSVAYGHGDTAVPAVQHINLDIERGEIFGLAGESGCGKSTLGLSILRLLPPTAHTTGRILFNDADLLTARWSQVRAVRWAGISMVFQGAMSALNPVKTIGEQVCEAILIHGLGGQSKAKARAIDLFEQVGIGGRRFGSYPHELSGGQRQRVMIAMALACEPDLIIADEPTTALDVMVQAQILQLLTDLVKANGISVILISHDLSVLAENCDRAAVMYAGKIVEIGPAARLFTAPRHPYTAALSRAFPRIGDQAARLHPAGLAGDAAMPSARKGCPFAPRCPVAMDACRTADLSLWPTSRESQAACLRVLPEYDGAPTVAPAAPAAAASRVAPELVPGAEPQVLLDAVDVKLEYPARGHSGPATAIDGVNLQIREREIVALIGESGCGKSSLARTLVGLVRPTAGHVDYQRSPLRYSTKSLREFRNRVQLILQDPAGALNPRQKVFDAVAEGLRLHHATDRLEEHVDAAMEQAGLHPPALYEERYPHELSGGQQQRVVIAGALTLQPSVIVADEPVSALDASARGEILALLLRLRDDLGLAALVVSHDLGLAWNIADRVAVMYLGRIVEVGDAETVLLHPSHPYTRALLSVLPTTEGGTLAKPSILAGEGPDPTNIPSGCRFHPRCPLFALFAEDDPRRERCLTADPALHDEPTGVEVACHFSGDREHEAEPQMQGAQQ